MAFLDLRFRRANRPVASDATAATAFRRTSSDTVALAAKASRDAKSGGARLYRWSFVIHKWSGLFAAVWLAVLGFTGVFLDHPSWRWQQQSKAPGWLTPKALEDQAARGVIRLLQIDPINPAIRIAGGPRGLWRSADGGVNWTRTAFPGGDSPQIFAIEPDPARGWERLWLATDDGVYVSRDNGASATPTALRGEFITSLTAGATTDDMLAVIDKSTIVRFGTEAPERIVTIDIAPLSAESRPKSESLLWFVFDLHFGKGIFDPLSSMAMNDVGGVGMFVLSITGILYWALPKWWKAQKKSSTAKESKTAKATKKATMLWLFRLHSVTLGIASALMLIYLSITGVFLGHGRELFAWLQAVRVSSAFLTPMLGMTSWNGQIDAIVSYPGQPDAFTIGSHLGLFTTFDSGRNWVLEEDEKGRPIVAARMRRLGEKVLMPNGMAGPSVIRGDDLVNHELSPRMEAEAMDHSAHASGVAPPAVRETRRDAAQARGNMGGMGGDVHALRRNSNGRKSGVEKRRQAVHYR